MTLVGRKERAIEFKISRFKPGLIDPPRFRSVVSARRAALLARAAAPDGERLRERALACSRVCPTGVNPTRHIADLRRMVGFWKEKDEDR